MNDILHGEIVRCNDCSCILDADYHTIGVCANCIDGPVDDLYEEQDWLSGIPTPWLDDDEDGYEGNY